MKNALIVILILISMVYATAFKKLHAETYTTTVENGVVKKDSIYLTEKVGLLDKIYKSLPNCSIDKLKKILDIINE